MSNQPVLEMRGISKAFFGHYAVKDVDFALYPGQVHSLLGENGAGKSTLIKILAGVHAQDEGDILIDGKPVSIRNTRHARELGITVVFQELNLVASLSAAENIFFGRLPSKGLGRVDWKKLYADAKRLLEEVGLPIDPHTRVGNLGVAQQQLIEIARALSQESKIIAMDEPTSALSPKEIEGLFQLIEALKRKQVAIIYVSHKFEELFAVTDRITVLRDGNKVDEVQTQAATKDDLISMMVGRPLTQLFPKTETHSGELSLQVKNLSTTKLHNVSFEAREGQIIGFSGLMGAGRTELARALFGLDRITAGEVWVGPRQMKSLTPRLAKQLGIGYIPEDRKEEALLMTAGLRENMTLATLSQFVRRWTVQKKPEKQAVTGAIRKLSIKAQSQEQKILSLSGGNQQKVIISRWLLHPKLNILIMDEPTRGIDVGSKSEIYNIMQELASSGILVLLMSSELPELLSMCDRIYVMNEGTIVGHFNRGDASQEKLIDKAIGGGITV